MNYDKAQAEWIKIHNLKRGDKVLVFCKAGEDSGWWASWIDEHMDPMVGWVYEVMNIGHEGQGIHLDGPNNNWWFPFYCLIPKKEVIDE